MVGLNEILSFTSIPIEGGKSALIIVKNLFQNTIVVELFEASAFKRFKNFAQSNSLDDYSSLVPDSTSEGIINIIEDPLRQPSLQSVISEATLADYLSELSLLFDNFILKTNLPSIIIQLIPSILVSDIKHHPSVNHIDLCHYSIKPGLYRDLILIGWPGIIQLYKDLYVLTYADSVDYVAIQQTVHNFVMSNVVQRKSDPAIQYHEEFCMHSLLTGYHHPTNAFLDSSAINLKRISNLIPNLAILFDISSGQSNQDEPERKQLFLIKDRVLDLTVFELIYGSRDFDNMLEIDDIAMFNASIEAKVNRLAGFEGAKLMGLTISGILIESALIKNSILYFNHLIPYIQSKKIGNTGNGELSILSQDYPVTMDKILSFCVNYDLELNRRGIQIPDFQPEHHIRLENMRLFFPQLFSRLVLPATEPLPVHEPYSSRMKRLLAVEDNSVWDLGIDDCNLVNNLVNVFRDTLENLERTDAISINAGKSVFLKHALTLVNHLAELRDGSYETAFHLHSAIARNHQLVVPETTSEITLSANKIVLRLQNKDEKVIPITVNKFLEIVYNHTPALLQSISEFEDLSEFDFVVTRVSVNSLKLNLDKTVNEFTLNKNTTIKLQLATAPPDRVFLDRKANLELFSIIFLIMFQNIKWVVQNGIAGLLIPLESSSGVYFHATPELLENPFYLFMMNQARNQWSSPSEKLFFTDIKNYPEEDTVDTLPDLVLLPAQLAKIRTLRIRIARNYRGFSLMTRITQDEVAELSSKFEEKFVTRRGFTKYESVSGDGLPVGYPPLDEDFSLVTAGGARGPMHLRLLLKKVINPSVPLEGTTYHPRETFTVFTFEEDHERSAVILSIDANHFKGLAEDEEVTMMVGATVLDNLLGDDFEGLSFAENEILGYINACPSNCGSGMRAGVMVKNVKLINDLLGEAESLPFKDIRVLFIAKLNELGQMHFDIRPEVGGEVGMETAIYKKGDYLDLTYNNKSVTPATGLKKLFEFLRTNL